MDILEACQTYLIHSEISRKCNMSHYDAAHNAQILVYLGMLQKTEVKGTFNRGGIEKQRFSWKTTPYGLECLKKSKETHELFKIEPQ